MGTGINPVQELVQLSTLGGYDHPLSPCASCFMILEDKPIKIRTGLGNVRYYPAGTFTTKTIYNMYVQEIKSGTEVGTQAILLGFDQNQVE